MGTVEVLTIDRYSKIPLYVQLKEILRHQVNSGVFPPGSLLPSENGLVARYGVSRITVRQALADIAHEGLIIRQSGRGSLVIRPKIADRSERTLNFIESLSALGYRPSSRILSFDRFSPTDELNALVDCILGDIITQYTRLAFADEEPIAISKVTLTAPPDVRLDPQILATSSVVPILRQEYKVRFDRADQTIEAKVADQLEAERLSISRGAPLLAIDSIAYDTNNRRRIYVAAVYRADRYKYGLSVPL